MTTLDFLIELTDSELVKLADEIAPRLTRSALTRLLVANSYISQAVLDSPEFTRSLSKVDFVTDVLRYVRHRRKLIPLVEALMEKGTLTMTFMAAWSGNEMGEPAKFKRAAAPATTTTPLLPAEVLLVTATRVEAEAVLDEARRYSGRKATTIHRGNQIYYDLGQVGQIHAVMVRTEAGTRGPSGSTLTISEALAALRPRAAILVGIAFGVDSEKQKMGQVLVARQLVDYELQRVGTGGDGKRYTVARGDRASATPGLLSRFRDGELTWHKAPLDFGVVLSGDKLVDNVAFRDQLLELEPEAIGGEMEGAGLYSVAVRERVDWILVKAICDWADGHKAVRKSERQRRAAKNAAQFVFHVLKQIGPYDP